MADSRTFNFLKVIDRLEVGPVKLEPRRLIAPYRVIRQGQADTTHLIYSYQEDVFEPGDHDYMNVGSFIAAQIALNYGLFCDEIVFYGVFEEQDRQFLRAMAENTAREIYVNKFLEPNLFITGPAADLPFIKQESYLQSKLLFDDNTQDTDNESGTWIKEKEWKTDASKVAVLLSGGKDSLLSYCLFKEMGYDVHPIFINESGRHWFTSLNAYRYFSKEISNTARVWTNSDRVFNWMLRHLPFVRKDYNKIRSDIYPIRLWTLAVFIAGGLPLLKKRGVGRLLIGDEFDTTVRSSFQGVTHYNGLYDQSIYFDKTISRFYRKKKWGIEQFSALRPLSEILIEKILVERYPDVQREQISCHSAHKDGERIKPCGRCEKCARIIGMLAAIGANPCECGYSEAQITSSLEAMKMKDLHQEKAAVEHLAYMLSSSNMISSPYIGKIKAKKRPEIMKIRFDPDKAPFEYFPPKLYAPLFKIFLDHADGAIRRDGRKWTEIEVYNIKYGTEYGKQ